MEIYFVDGQFVPADRAVIPVNDLAVLRGYGVFDLMRTHGGAPLFLEDHIRRLMHSAEAIGLRLRWTEAELTTVVVDTLERNRHLPEANIRIVITGGPSADFSTPQHRPRLLVLVSEVPRLPDTWYTDGVKIVTVRAERFQPGVKSINYIPATIAMQTARAQGAVEAVYVDRTGRVLEGTASNIFAFIRDRLVTPGEDILPGITRKAVLETAGSLFSTEIRNLTREELLGAEEVFISGTNKGVVPVIAVDGKPIGTGRPGPKTRRIIRTLGERVARHGNAGNRESEDHPN